MKNFVDHIKANKALYIKRSLVIVATGATIAVVAYAVKHGADDSVEIVSLPEGAFLVTDAA